MFQPLEERAVLAPVPIVTVSDPGPAMIGEDVQFSVTFDNQATGAPEVGYGPYVDLFVDTTGADGVFPGVVEPNNYDGLGVINATYLGTSLTVTPVTLGPGATFVHPFALDATGSPLVGSAPAGFVRGDTLFVVELPFGSFVDAQPTANIAIRSNLDSEADLGTDLQIAAIGGFRFGADPLNNPLTDAPIRGATATQIVTPTVVTLSKEYIGPEDETATGPNYPRRYTISADVAAGQTVTDLRLQDFLPNNLAFLSIVSTSPAGATVEQQPTVGVAANPTDNDLIVHFASVTGGASTSDASVTIEFFVPEFDADGSRIISATTGNDVTSLNDSRLSAGWVPNDPSDLPASINIVDQAGGADNHTLTDKSIAIQKDVRVLNDIGAPGATPGDTMLYTLTFQISDYFSFGDIVIDDAISDGQRLAGSPSGPFTSPFQLTVSDRNGAIGGLFTPSTVPGATNLFIDSSQIGNDPNPATDGSTRLVFDVSRALVEFGAADGVLQGGRTVLPNAGPATGTITFQTVIQEEFSDTYPSGGPTVDQGDQLSNQVSISGRIRDNANLTTLLGTEADTSSATFEIVTGDLLKTVYAINGILGNVNPAIDTESGLQIGPSFPNNVQVRPGDDVTYRLRYVLPTGDVEQFRITDYLPLPVFDASSFSSILNTTIDAAAPAADTAKYGPDHSFSRIPAAGPPTRDPGISVSNAANSITFDFGTYDDPPPEQQTLVDLLFSVTITDAPMADGLFLTNQAQGIHGTTNTQPVVDEAIIQVILGQPNLSFRKGIVSTDSLNGTFTGTVAPAGISFEAPGLNTASSFSGGTIRSSNLGTTLDANLSNIDAGDLVKFVMVIENTGSSTSGAYDVRFRDDLPVGFVIPPSGPGLNLEVFDGTGAVMPFTSIGSGLFDPTGGIELNDPGPTPPAIAGSPPLTINGGALDGFDSASGRNIAIVTFDLQVADDVQPGQTNGLLNTATVFNYAGYEGGRDHTNPTDLTDPAQVSVALPINSKTIDATSETHTGFVAGREQVAVGEVVRFRLVTTLPEGESPNLRIRDFLPRGLQFLDDGTATIALVSSSVSGLTSSVPALAAASVVGTSSFEPTFPLPASTIQGGPFVSGRDPLFNLGTLTNSDRDADEEYVIVEFNTLVLNSTVGSNDAGDTRSNLYRVEMNGRRVGSNSGRARVRIVEPSLSLTKSVSPRSVDAGDTVTYSVVYRNRTGSTRSTAFEVQLLDTLPSDLTLVPGSLTITPLGGAVGVLDSSSGNTIDVLLDEMPPGSRVRLSYDAVVGIGISPAEVLNNSAAVRYTSLPGPLGTTVNSTGSATPGATGTDTGERDGSGIAKNDYVVTRTAPVNGRLPVTAKSRLSTSIDGPNNNSGQVVVGELVTYELVVTIPEGQTDAARVVDTLDPGLALVDVLSVSSASALTIANPIGTGTAPANVGVTNNGSVVSFNFGDIVNSDTDNGVAERIRIQYRAVVLNVASNQSTPITDLDNRAQLSWTGNNLPPVSSSPVRVIEPDLQVQKTASPIQIDANDVVTFTLAIDHSSLSNANANDVTMVDVIPTGFSYVASSLSLVSGVVPLSLGESAGTITATWSQLALGQTTTLSFQATVDTLATAGSSLTNTSLVEWTSLSGPTGSDLSVYNSNSRERTGTGGVNDYRTSDSATVSLDIGVNKSIVATSEASTSGTDVAVGEIVRYHVWVQLPEGAAPGFQVVDALPAGLQFLDDGTARFAMVSNGAGIVSSTLGAGVVQAGASGTIVPTFVLPAAAISGQPFVDGADPVFSFGDLINADNDSDAEFVVLEFNTIVLNTALNVAGQTHQNLFSVNVGGAPIGPASNTVVTRVVEPSITDVAKSVLPPANLGADANQTVTYSVTYSNSTSPTAATAFDVSLRDALPASLTSLSNVQVLRNGSPIATGFTNSSSATVLDVVVDQVAIGDAIEVRYDAVVTSATSAGTAINNTANLQYSSLPGDQGTVPNPTGSVAGPSGTLVGERNGTGGINTYRDSNGASITTFSHTVSGFVYRDQNNNGLFDEAASAGLPGVTVRLTGIDHLGNGINRTTTTNAAGAYGFAGLRPGDYTVTEQQPAGFLNGLDTLGAPVLGAVNVSRYDDILGTLTIPVGTPSLSSVNHNFGELDPATVSGFVYVDGDNNGLRAVEPGILGTSVRLTGTDDRGNAVSLTTTTAPSGAYQFAGLRPGTYQVDEVQPAAYVDGFETRGNVTPIPGSDGGLDTINGITVSSGQIASNNNFGELLPGVVSGRVFVDIANDGFLSGNDFGLGGINLTLTGVDVNGRAVTRSTTTLPDGTYQFRGLVGGTYSVSEPTQPAGYLDGQETRNNVLLPSSVGTDLIPNIVLPLGGSAAQNNFGEVPIVDPQGYVYIDANRNGVRDVGEIGVAGVPVTLTGVGVDVFGNAIVPQVVLTDANGFYQFANLPPGRFTLTETQPVGLQDGQEQNGTPPAAIVNNDQFVDINLTNDILGGDYNFGELSPNGSLAGSVYVDRNNNGRREANELGLAGVTMTIVDQNNPSGGVSVVTDANGRYRFVKMFPGTYRLTQSQPINFVDGRDTGGTAGGSVGNDVIANISLGVNESATGYLFGELGVRPDRVTKREFLASTRPGIDFTGRPGSGVAAVGVPLADPSGFVYVDLNQDGQRDLSEPGIAGVRIDLLGQTDTGQVVRQQRVTNAYGFYQFAFLPPGVYQLAQVQPIGFLDGAETIGSHGGIIVDDGFAEIVLQAGDVGVDYNFGEILPNLTEGDVDGNGEVDATDVNELCSAIQARNPWYDLNDDDSVNADDLLYFVRTVLSTEPGDVNLDGRFDSSDLQRAFAAGEYEDGIDGNSNWITGDWNCDGEFSTSDLVLALQSGNYEANSLPLNDVAAAVDRSTPSARTVDAIFAE